MIKFYLFFMLFAYGIGVAISAYHLCRNDYPRYKETNAFQDVFGMLLAFGLMIWVAIILKGML